MGQLQRLKQQRLVSTIGSEIRIGRLSWQSTRAEWRRRSSLPAPHRDWSSFFLIDEGATRHDGLSASIGDLNAVLERLRPGSVATPSESEGLCGTAPRRLRLLVADPFLPAYDKAAGSLRLFRILELLRAAGHEVTYIARDGDGPKTGGPGSRGGERYRRELEALGIVVHAGDPERLRQRGFAAAGPPLDLAGLLRNGRFDIAWLSFYELAEQYLPEIREHSPSTRILVDSVDVHWLRLRREGELQRDSQRLRHARITRLKERNVYRAADAVIAVSEDDARSLRQMAPDTPIYLLGTVHPSEDPGPGAGSRSGVVFVGNFNHRPNVDAALHLVNDVMPRVWAMRPEVKVVLVGTNPPPAVRDLAGESVTVTGHVPATRPYLDDARVSVAPLRFGAGVKGKIGEALAAGVPVVTTSIGAEGMGLVNGVHALVDDTVTGLAGAIVQLHTDAELWERLSVSGKQEVEHRFGHEATRVQLNAILEAASRTAFVWVPNWEGEEEMDGVLSSYVSGFSVGGPVTLVVGLDVTLGRSGEQAVQALAASLRRTGSDPNHAPNIAVVRFSPEHPEELLCPGAVWVPTRADLRLPVLAEPPAA